MAKNKFDKYLFYENSVQTPTEHVYIFDKMFREIRNEVPRTLREDFCGTFLISCEWAKSDPKRTALGLDLDSEPTQYGMKHGYKKLNADQKKRVKIRNQDVCIPSKGKGFDVIGACNFSFNIFHSRALMKKYFKAALQSLNKDGIFVLELAGGPGFIRTQKEQKTYTVRGLGKYTYYWDQKSFDPITHHGLYAIHFKDRYGTLHRDCFIYDWRVWTIPELKKMMHESGFKDVAVYWEESNKDGQGNGEFKRMAKGDNAYSWIAFVVGIK